MDTIIVLIIITVIPVIIATLDCTYYESWKTDEETIRGLSD